MNRTFRQGSWVLRVILGSGLLLGLSACVVIKGAEAPSVPAEDGNLLTIPVSDPLPTTIVVSQPAREAISEQQPAEIRRTNRIDTSIPIPTPTAGPAPAGIRPPTATPTHFSTAPTLDLSMLSTDPEYYISGFACTGSMRPVLDCGDEAEFLRPPFPRDLVEGDIISFLPDISCRYYKFQEISKAHRIIAVRLENNVPYYTTKGDSSSNPDPCEITPGQIDGLLVAVRKGVRPQDIIDTSEYDRAKERVQQLKQEYAQLTKLYDQKKILYESLVVDYQNLVYDYQAGESSYNLVAGSYQKLEEERVALNALRDVLNGLTDAVNESINQVDRIYQKLFAN